MKRKTKTPEKTSDEKRRELRANAAHAEALEGYSGWDNYETWLVHQWLDNEQATQEAAKILARPGAEHEAADRLKDYVDTLLPEMEGFAADLLGAALSEVNWSEIARSYREEE